MPPLEVLIPLAFLVGFPLFWILIGKLIAQGGWARLAKQFETTRPAAGRRVRIGSARVGLANYNNVLRLHAQPDGLRMSVLGIFRSGHPPLLIPWDAISDIEPVKVLWYRGYTLQVGEPPVAIQLPASIVEDLGELGLDTEPPASAL